MTLFAPTFLKYFKGFFTQTLTYFAHKHQGSKLLAPLIWIVANLSRASRFNGLLAQTFDFS